MRRYGISRGLFPFVPLIDIFPIFIVISATYLLVIFHLLLLLEHTGVTLLEEKWLDHWLQEIVKKHVIM